MACEKVCTRSGGGTSLSLRPLLRPKYSMIYAFSTSKISRQKIGVNKRSPGAEWRTPIVFLNHRIGYTRGSVCMYYSATPT